MGLILQGEWRRPTSLRKDEAPRDDKLLAMYCLSADILNAIGHTEDPPQQMSDAEVITTGLVAMWFFRGNFEAARALLGAPRYLPPMLSRRRVNRRLHRLTDLFVMLCDLLGDTWKQLNTESVSVIASFPVGVGDKYRIPRAKFYQHEEDRGCLASKKRYVDGRNVHLLVPKDGQPVEWCLTPGSYRDGGMLQTFRCDIPEGSHVYAEKAYHDDAMEDVLLEASPIQLYPIRKKNATRTLPPSIA
jgi:hypothetical protein